LSSISPKKESHLQFMNELDTIPDIEAFKRANYPQETTNIGYTDTHMHIDNMEGKKWRVPTQEVISYYLSQKGIVQAGTIFEEGVSVNKLLNTLEDKEIDCSIVPFLFVHNPYEIDREKVEYLYTSNLLKGFKLHPVYDNYPLSYDLLHNLFEISKEYGSLPILMHLDDRKDSMDLTAPHRLDRLIESMIEKDRIVPLILGHTGAYAHPRLVLYKSKPNPPVLQYWKNQSPENEANYSRIYLIKHALQLAKEYPFVYLDSSSCINKIKAKLISDAVNQFPQLSRKILLGTDFPVLSQHKKKKDGSTSFNVGVTVNGQLEALWNQGLKKEHLLQIASNRIP